MRLVLILPLLALFLTACGGGGSRQASSSARPVDRAYPAFEDADPHPWTGRRPERYPVHGLDVSRWQQDIDWTSARAAGISFVFIKATEGVEEIDPKFETHWAGAGRAGLPRAAYHYFYFCAPAAAQARWFIANVPRILGGLPHVLDMEWNHRSPTCRKRPPGPEVRSEAKTFLDILEAHYGQRPILYTTVDFWEDTGIGRLPGTRFWLRSVSAQPAERYPGANWDFWQYTGTGLVPGVPGKVDINVFRGSVQSWQRYPG
ncbi:GH25 family lysozyme [Tropicimonas sp. IMCC6043]|uniref:glycoside hydrolase family 25 protein n=1 Tax=Tropicimonas sp. IMCC6043 TaxID=2510645 RepID=UPI00101B5C3F|nr:GH25 family lysozyme [Tropicimonas sp. IMCC6043]RYH10884.1 glycoside hydrolase [Tropicimonas sp. IMCC6043]